MEMCPLYTSLSFTCSRGPQRLCCGKNAGIQSRGCLKVTHSVCVSHHSPARQVLLMQPRLRVIQMKNKAFPRIGTPSFIWRWNVHCQTYHSYYGNYRANCRVVLASLPAVIFTKSEDLHWGFVEWRGWGEKVCRWQICVPEPRRQRRRETWSTDQRQGGWDPHTDASFSAAHCIFIPL